MTGALGLIAGNGRFPFLVAREARRQGRRVVAVAIREEAAPEIEAEADETHWVSVGQLGRCLDVLKRAGVTEAVMAGQVKHRRIFSDIVPDLKLMGVLAKLAFKNTDSLIGGVADALEGEGVRLVSSTGLLGSHLATEGPMTRRKPSAVERRDMAYGVGVARALTAVDVGQTVVVKDRAAVAVEAMEGTDEVIRRAGSLAGPGCVVVKLAKPKQDPRFDVPVVGLDTLEAMKAAGASILAIEAGKTLMIDKRDLLIRADGQGLGVYGVSAADHE